MRSRLIKALNNRFYVKFMQLEIGLLTIHVPIKLSSTLEGDLIIKITKVKPCLHISHKDRKHMVANTRLLSFPGMPWSSHM